MATITMVIETIPLEDGGPDPKLCDPREIAEQMVSEHYEGCMAEGEPEETVKLMSAEWADEISVVRKVRAILETVDEDNPDGTTYYVQRLNLADALTKIRKAVK